jgi:hypothetical protein
LYLKGALVVTFGSLRIPEQVFDRAQIVQRGGDRKSARDSLLLNSQSL